ncbi:hypothetical protein EBE87_25105 [Pseudoroseomonas wenyumeiae]|uniref:HpcH/HpaI aldolase/citrate lyase domain-containing protein n=1 Tax=Teichococcus wenyumeiae TaxID=2478470 RepID=A0A3A9JAY5_9PROT|nr:aldolase/citrate lyase family protein [Pseudoroseomonas wenyumeiae]RKK02671.1 hypothetical protein D6Z83_18610 [Pseudoroseomonas wenyumeiae]RMI15587.1 hypothetical protein EBE87_25105 [Pseudoroseomonas wenyumeiae]
MAQMLKARMRAGENLVGCFIMLPSPALVEMAGYAGFDFVILDTEHGAATSETLEHQLRAADASGISALVRTSSMNPGEILRVLDAGATGIVVPHVRTPADAEAIASAAHYPPYGCRGIATTSRAGRHGFISVAEHLSRAHDSTIVLPQIEDADALPYVSAIAGTAGVDGIFIGPADLSISLGHPGNHSDPQVLAAIEKAAQEACAAGSIVSTFASSSNEANAFFRRGIKMVMFSTTSLFTATLRDTVSGLLK